MVMAPIALALLKTDIPAILKYPILALTTYAASNLIVYAYTRTAELLSKTPGSGRDHPYRSRFQRPPRWMF